MLTYVYNKQNKYPSEQAPIKQEHCWHVAPYFPGSHSHVFVKVQLAGSDQLLIIMNPYKILNEYIRLQNGYGLPFAHVQFPEVSSHVPLWLQVTG